VKLTPPDVLATGAAAGTRGADAAMGLTVAGAGAGARVVPVGAGPGAGAVAVEGAA